MSIEKRFPKPFKGQLVGYGEFSLLADFEYHCENGDIIVVPIGFITDGGSIPRIARPLIGSPWGGRYTKICIIHDYLCATKKYSRIRTQQIFLEGLEVLGVPSWKRPLMYAGVRAYSWFFWGRLAALLIPFVLQGCASLSIIYNEDGSIAKVESTGIQDTLVQIDEHRKVHRKTAVELWPQIPPITMK